MMNGGQHVFAFFAASTFDERSVLFRMVSQFKFVACRKTEIRTGTLEWCCAGLPLPPDESGLRFDQHLYQGTRRG